MRTDGGPAFPMPGHVDGGGDRTWGLSKREWFAGLAMQAIFTSLKSEADYEVLRILASNDGLTGYEWIARAAVNQADAMVRVCKQG